MIADCGLRIADFLNLNRLSEIAKRRNLWRFANACTGPQTVQYGERERPEPRSIGLLIEVRVAHAPRTVPEIAPLSRTSNRNPL